jgi:uncharacterized membrane protein
MDLFLATCQGIGLALAAGAATGAITGAVAARDEAGAPGGVLAVLAGLALIGGAILFGASLSAEDHPAWPGWIVGALVALLAFSVLSGVVRGAATRGQGASAGAQVVYVVVAAAILAAISLTVASPLAVAVLVAVGWLALARRRRAARKHEGLRVLR